MRKPLLLPLGAFLVASLFSAAFALDPATAFWALKSEWLPIVFFLVCVNTLGIRSADRHVRLLVIAGSCAALVGLYQTVMRGPSFRVHGVFGHYMTFAGVLLLVSLLALAQLLFHPEKGRRPWMFACTGLVLLALLMTQTRSAWLGLVAGCIPLLWGVSRRMLLALPVVLLVLVLVLLLVAPQPVQERLRSVVDPSDVTYLERLYIWQGGWNIFREYPILGAGPDNLASIYARYKDPRDPRLRFTHLHSNVLQIAAERGALALGAWLWIWISFLISATRLYRAAPSRAGPGSSPGPQKALLLGAISGVVGFLVAGLFECNYRDSEVAALIYFTLALPYCAPRDEARRRTATSMAAPGGAPS